MISLYFKTYILHFRKMKLHTVCSNSNCNFCINSLEDSDLPSLELDDREPLEIELDL